MTRGAMTKVDGEPVSPSHRYYTRSCGNPEPPKHQRHSSDERRLHRRAPPEQMPSRRSQLSHDTCSRTETNDSDSMQDSDPIESDTMMDVDSFAPIRAPFPSPAMKATQPLVSYPTSQQGGGSYGPSEATWIQQAQSWQQGGVPTGTCILVEAANRAQMAILMDDMGCMAIEQTDQE